MGKRPYDIDERVFLFACEVIDFVRTVKWEPGIYRLGEQLVDAAGSVGANRHESSAGSTPLEFIRLNTIALREARESHFWLRLCQAKKIGGAELCAPLVGEADEIKRILAAIIVQKRANLPKREKARKRRRTS